MIYKDTLYASPINKIESFEFNEQVTSVFQDMVSRSIPGYRDIMTMTGIMAGTYATPDSNIYDLGCSLGASSLATCQHTKTKSSLIGVDNSPAMIEKYKQNLQTCNTNLNISTQCKNLLDIKIHNASVVILNFVLQFINLNLRNKLLHNIYQGLNQQGVLLIAEKIKFDDITTQTQITNWHEKFKQANGYSDLEISQKRTALENVLISDTDEVLIERFKSAGFSIVQPWFQNLNFKAFVVFK